MDGTFIPGDAAGAAIANNLLGLLLIAVAVALYFAADHYYRYCRVGASKLCFVGTTLFGIFGAVILFKLPIT